MNFHTLRDYLCTCGVFPDSPTLTLDQYTRVVENARENFGDKVAAFLMDCFMPEGEPVEPGYEDSLSHYSFTPTSWAELEKDWTESFT